MLFFHDSAYDVGGSLLDFLNANVDLGACIAALHHPIWGAIFTIFTTIFGWHWWTKAAAARLADQPSGAPMTVTASQIRRLFPNAKADLVNAVVGEWEKAVASGIATRKRKAMFFSNIGVETGGLTILVENMNYSAERLMSVWPSRFPTAAKAKRYAKQPKKLANFVYGGRLGNRPGTDDGWNFRGSGMMQSTGRENFLKAGTALGVDFISKPDLLRQPVYAFRSAVVEWERRGCNKLADAGNLTACRKAINGGTNGLEDVNAYYGKALKIFSDDDAAPAARRSFVDLPEPADTADLKMEDDDPAVDEKPDPDLVKIVQKLLREKGYPEVGNIDGIPGKRVSAAILAFQNDNDLDLTGEVSSDLVKELASSPAREISADRAEATAKDLAGSPSIDAGQGMKVLGGLTAGAGTIGSMVDLQQKAADFKSLSETMLSMSPWIIGIGVGLVVVYFGQKIVREQVRKYRSGNHV